MRVIGEKSVASLLTVCLNVAWYASLGGAILMTCLVLLPMWVDVSNGQMDIPVTFSLQAQPLAASAPTLGIERAEIRKARGEGYLTFAPPTGGFLAAVAVVPAAAMLLVWWIVGQMRAVFRTLRAGQPFVPANATRIRRIAYALILGELLRSAVTLMGGYFTLSHFTAAGVQFLARPNVNLFTIGQGLIILVISEVFRIGSRLDEEQSLTV